jgi:hypothetical protein
MIKDFLDTPIFITGIERSGSTIIAKIIQQCNVWTGATTEMFENDYIRRQVNKYYANIHCPINGQFPLPDTSEVLIPNNWKRNIEEYLIRERFMGEKAWMYKNNRICQIWPIWNYAYPNAKWIIVRRRTGDIVSSCMKTAYMTAFKDKQNQKFVNVENEQEGWLWWVHQHEKLFVEMIENGLNCKVIWPERMVYGDYQQIYEMLEWLGLKWNNSIIEMVQPMLMNSKQKIGG